MNPGPLKREKQREERGWVEGWKEDEWQWVCREEEEEEKEALRLITSSSVVL